MTYCLDSWGAKPVPRGKRLSNPLNATPSPARTKRMERAMPASGHERPLKFETVTCTLSGLPGAVGHTRHFGAIKTERSEEHTSELQSLRHLVCRLLLEKKKKKLTSTADGRASRMELSASSAGRCY